MLTPLATLFVLAFVFNRGLGAVPPAVLVNYTRPGDLIIGAVIAFHFDSACRSGLTLRQVEIVETFVYAIKQINNRSDILPNITLGFDIRDSCYDEDTALWSLLSLLGTYFRSETGLMTLPVPDQKNSGKLLGLVGTSRSTTSIFNAKVAHLFDLPMISHFATSDELSDKVRFPNFLRTVPPDKLQAKAMVDILLRFGWHCIGVLYTSDAYGIYGSQELFRLADKQEDICIAFSKAVNGGTATEADIKEVVSKINEFEMVHVIIVFGGVEMYSILDELQRTKPGYTVTLICSDGIRRQRISEVYLGNMTKGSLHLSQHRQGTPEFQDYFKALEETGIVSPWYNEFKVSWMESNKCANFTECPFTSPAVIESSMFHAVHAFAHALDDFQSYVCFGKHPDCSIPLEQINGKDLIPYLFNVSFYGVDGWFEFNADGDSQGAYDVTSLLEENGKIGWQSVGQWDSRRSEKLSMIDSDILWPEGVPRSFCRQECSSGEIAVRLQLTCCWECQECYENTIVEDNTCIGCPSAHWPSKNRTTCHPIVPSSVGVHEVIIIVILVLCCNGVIMAVLSFAGLYHYRNHSLIKASSRELGMIAITGTICACLVPLPLLLPPSDHTCAASEAQVSLCFTLIYAPTLLKVNRISRVFDASKRSTKCPRLARPKQQIIIAMMTVLIQVVIVVVSGITDNLSKPELLFPNKLRNYMEIYCQFRIGFIASCVYNLLLILACCYYAFKTRKVPSNYNESKFIAVSVYSTLVLCLAAVPVYATAVMVLQKVATLCMAVLLNAYLTLICVYLPKLYAARFVKNVVLLKCSNSVSRGSSCRVHPFPGPTTGVTQDMPPVTG